MENGLIGIFYRCRLVLISGGGKLRISIIELPLPYCFEDIILAMSVKSSYRCLASCLLIIVCALFRKRLNTLFKFFPKGQLREPFFDFHHKLLSRFSLAILSNYLIHDVYLT